MRKRNTLPLNKVIRKSMNFKACIYPHICRKENHQGQSINKVLENNVTSFMQRRNLRKAKYSKIPNVGPLRMWPWSVHSNHLKSSISKASFFLSQMAKSLYKHYNNNKKKVRQKSFSSISFTSGTNSTCTLILHSHQGKVVSILVITNN